MQQLRDHDRAGMIAYMAELRSVILKLNFHLVHYTFLIPPQCDEAESLSSMSCWKVRHESSHRSSHLGSHLNSIKSSLLLHMNHLLLHMNHLTLNFIFFDTHDELKLRVYVRF